MLHLALTLPLFAPAPLAPAMQADASAELFPAPSAALRIEHGEDGAPMKMADLVSKYAQLTGQSLTYGEDTKALLMQTNINVDRPFDVPAAEVQSIFEHFLRQHDFCLNVLTTEGVRMVEVLSLRTAARSNLRTNAMFIDEAQLATAAKHPAILFSTVVTLPNTDVRQLSNSMRTMITDANTQQMLPAGNSNSMVLVGFGDTIASLADALQLIDRAASIGAEDRKVEHNVVVLEKANAGELSGTLIRVLRIDPEGPSTTRIHSDARTNSLIVSARKAEMGEILNLIARLDI